MTEEQSKVITATEFWQELQSRDLQHIRVVMPVGALVRHAGPLRTPFPSRRLRFLKPRQVVVYLVEPRSNGIARETRRLPPKTLEFSCRPPREDAPNTPSATSEKPEPRSKYFAP